MKNNHNTVFATPVVKFLGHRYAIDIVWPPLPFRLQKRILYEFFKPPESWELWSLKAYVEQWIIWIWGPFIVYRSYFSEQQDLKMLEAFRQKEKVKLN